MDSTTRFFRIALVANPSYGCCSMSWRMKAALEACGHTVMTFTPKTHPFLFEAADGEGGDAGERAEAAGAVAGAPAAAGAGAGAVGAAAGAEAADENSVPGANAAAGAAGAASAAAAGDAAAADGKSGPAREIGAAATPVTAPSAGSCSGDLSFDASRLKRFFAVQKLDVFVTADGVAAFGVPEALPDETVYGIACVTRTDASACAASFKAAASEGRAPDFAFSLSAEASAVLSRAKGLQVIDVEPLADRAYVRTPLANTVALAPGLLIMQDETPDRRAFADALRMRFSNAGRTCPIRVQGQGWDGFEHIGSKFASFAYALRATRAVVLFADSADEPAAGAAGGSATSSSPAHAASTSLAHLDGLIALALADGAEVVSVGEPPQLHHASRIKVCAKASEALDVCQAALLEPAQPAPDGDTCNMLEDVLDDALRQALASRTDAGSARPRAIVCALGYYGCGNFGDEYILETLDDRVRTLDEGASLIAVSEHPDHTLEKRGIYAVTVSGKRQLDAVLAHASAMLVTAGLLFDQGIRWTCGKAEMLSNAPCPDIPSIAGAVALAAANDAQPIMHGVGAGPLEVEDSRKLVALMGKLGTLFAARDQATLDLIAACDVPADQLLLSADTAFLAAAPSTDAAREALREAGFDPEKHKLIAVSLREYEGMPADFANRIAVALDVLLDHADDTRVVFCALDAADTLLLREVAKRMRRSSLTTLYDACDDVRAMAGMLTLCWSGLSMRYHASVLLMSSGKPCVGIGYLPKVNALYAETGASDVLLGMDATADDVYAALDRIVFEYDDRAKAVCKGRDVLVDRAKEGEKLPKQALRRGGAKAGFVERAFFLEDEPAAERHAREEARRACEAETRELAGRVSQLEEENRALAARVAELEQSTSFKLGSTLLKAPCALKDKIAEGRERLGK